MKSWISLFPCLICLFASSVRAEGVDYRRVAQDLEGALGASYEVRRGGITFLTPETCAGLPTCFGNNPDSPYGIPLVPTADVKAPNPFSALDQGSNRALFQIAPEEGVVMVLVTPPKAAYFGFTAYLYDYPSQRTTSNFLLSSSYGSLEDTINSATIRTTGGAGPFSAVTVLISTSDKRLESAVRRALTDIGFPGSAVNSLPLPKNSPVPGVPGARVTFRMGEGVLAERFNYLLRVGLPNDAASFAAYRQAPPFVLMRLTPRASGAAASVDLIPAPPLRPEGTGVCEATSDAGCASVLDSSLAERLSSLERAVTDRYRALGYTVRAEDATGISTPPAEGTEGRVCNYLRYSCAGDNRDALYLIDVAAVKLPQTPDDFYVLVGVDHTKYGKATYQSHSVYRLSNQQGVAGFSNRKFVSGGVNSADYLAGAPNGTFENLYAVKLARDCNGEGFCVKIESGGTLGVPVDEPVSITNRVYLEPVTNVRPSRREIQLERVLHVTKRR